MLYTQNLQSLRLLSQPLDLPFVVGRFEDVVTHILKQHKKTIVLACPIYDLAQASSKKDIRDVYEKIDIFTTDGMPLVWWFRLKTRSMIERVYGPDMMKEVLHREKNTRSKHCFICPNQSVFSILSKKFAQQIKAKRFFLILIGLSNDPKEKKRVADWVTEKSPRFVWIGIGSPNQAKLATYMKKTSPAQCTYFCVGAALPFLTGTVAQAPVWMRKSGLEWLFRLYAEPKRLWRRYLIDSPWFLFRLVFATIRYSS